MTENKIPVVNIVRKEDQVKILKEEYKQEYVLNSESPDFKAELKPLLRKLRTNVALECVGGEMTGTLVNALPRGATCFLYGNLSGQDVCGINTLQMIGNNVTLKGWFLGEEIKK